MRSMLRMDGARFLAEMLAGSGKKINGLYVEYGTTAPTFVDDHGPSYYEGLLHSQDGGYARIPVQSAAVCEDGGVLFTGLVTGSDLKGARITRNSVLTGAALVHMPDDIVANDIILYATLFTSPVKVVKGAYTNISVKLAIGA